MKKHIKNIIICLILCITTLIFSNINISYAKEDIHWIIPEKTQKFRDWENLPDEERKNTAMPALFGETLKNSIKRSEYNSILSENKATVESNYQRPSITVKNQRQSGTCWAFAFSSVLEGSGSGKVYSPYYLNYIVSTMYNKTITTGANFRLALGASSSGKAPVLETKMPIDSVYNETTNSASNEYMIPLDQLPAGALNQTIDARITDAIYFPGIHKEIVNENGDIRYSDGEGKNYTSSEIQALRTVIKEHIKSKGPVFSDIYQELEQSYNANTGAYCYKGDKQSNHAVTIVGWDDNYAVSNFNQANRPKNPGAYIALNSQGNTIGKDGYLYISYEDKIIEESMYGISGIEEYTNIDEIPYDKIYQYDELGYSYTVGANTNKLMAANVFSRDNSKIEHINEVGVFIPSTMGIQVYVNGNNGDKTQLTQVAVEVNNIEPGYHVIKLANPIKLTGDKFVVAVKYINKEEKGRIPLETNLKEAGVMDKSNFFDTAKANAGESFVSLDEGTSWQDINGLKISDTITLRNTNACIKAYTTTSNEPVTTPVTGVSLNKNSIRLKVGETENLTATVMPNDATNKNVIWNTSDEEIATVENGVITAKAPGGISVEVTTQDGNYTARCDVTVEEKEEEPTIINVTGVELDKKEITIKVGETQNLEATVKPENATNKNITWNSSDEEIATVENGVVTGVKEGNTTITVTTEDGNHTSICNIEVTKETLEPTKVDVTGVTLNKKTLSLEVGDTGNLVATISPKDATLKEVKWESSNEKVATISETGIIKAISEGKTTIKVTTLDGNFSATCELTVTKKKNTADDIYKEDDNKPSSGNSGTTNDKNTIKGDNTVANTKIPYAGNNTILIIGIILGIIIMAVVFIKVRGLRDVK